MIKRIIYGVIGILIGVVIYSTLLINIPNEVLPDVGKMPDRETTNEYYAGRDPIFFETYHIYEDDVRYFESIDLVTYGRNNPMWYWERVNARPDAPEDGEEAIPSGSVLGFDTETRDLAVVDVSAIDAYIRTDGHLPVYETFFSVSSPFGPRKDPFTGSEAFHFGIDIASEYINGREVFAMLPGVVKYSSAHGNYGNVVIISHGNYDTVYAHLEGFAENLKAGDEIMSGEVIGYVGSTGRSTGPHLHLEFDVEGVKVDPQRFIDIMNGVPVDVPTNPEGVNPNDGGTPGETDEPFDYERTPVDRFVMPEDER